MKFKLTAINKEYFPTIEIEAETIEEAKTRYIDEWQRGNIAVSNSELIIFPVEDGLMDRET